MKCLSVGVVSVLGFGFLLITRLDSYLDGKEQGSPCYVSVPLQHFAQITDILH
ncbi:hypothetical protein I79_002137 [Cricetulus griseus]|uniref:Uncharacterized protein n=1 Tax=Cricetulus griseus TaxID=10029 RepID=G3GWL0_CRIGR|nr:hypothetical protein I79_002137 [Cricetulus griseus]